MSKLIILMICLPKRSYLKGKIVCPAIGEIYIHAAFRPSLMADSYARVAQLVELHVANVVVAGSSPVSRSKKRG